MKALAKSLAGGAALATMVLAAVPAAADWSARRVYDPLTSETRCVAESGVVTLHDGYQETRLRLRVDRAMVAVVTESNIDGNRADAGIAVDDHPLTLLDAIALEQTALFQKQAASLIEQFKAGREAVVQLHFWPTWAPRGLKKARVSLIGFTNAFARLPDCS